MWSALRLSFSSSKKRLHFFRSAARNESWFLAHPHELDPLSKRRVSHVRQRRLVKSTLPMFESGLGVAANARTNSFGGALAVFDKSQCLFVESILCAGEAVAA
jgi:hypothetical protein